MKVSELIAKLQQMPQDLEVWTYDGDGYDRTVSEPYVSTNAPAYGYERESKEVVFI
jgi:hypothetical protein